jgi:hypothetical protein
MYHSLYYISTLNLSHTAHFCDVVDWIHLLKDMEQWQTLVNEYFRFHKVLGISWWLIYQEGDR